VRKDWPHLRTRYFDTHPVIGVHIRRTDLNRVLAGDRSHYVSPTSLFIGRMRHLLATCPDAMFFLSTDDRQEEERILAELPAGYSPNPKRTAAGIQRRESGRPRRLAALAEHG